MKRILLSIILLACAVSAHAQFTPNTVLTAAALNSALASPAITGGSINGSTAITTSGPVTLTGTNNLGALTSATTPSYVSNSGLVATDIFVRRTLLAATATVPISTTGGLYNTAPVGTGAIFGVTTSGGAVASITSIVAGGTGYQVGDAVVLVGGNGDAFVWVTAVSGGAISTATVLYGGTGYSGSPQLSGMGVPAGSRTVAMTGTLTSNVTLIVPSGTYLAGARRFGMENNTTGPFTVTVKLSNGAGGSTGTGVVVPQGTANNATMLLYTDGVSDIWPEVGSAVNLTVTGALTVGGVSVLPALSGTTGSLGGSNITTGACLTTAATVTGAATTMGVNATPRTFPGAGFFWYGYVSASNTVTVAVCSALGGMNAPTASLYNVRVFQ